MRLLTNAAVLSLTIPLSACMGGGDEGGIEIVTSSGLLSIELPAPSERGAYSSETQDLITTVETVNETVMRDMTPTGDTTYTGTFGLLFEEDPTVITGMMEVEVNSTGDMFDATMTATTVENSSFSTVTGSLTADGDIFDGYYASDLTGSFTGDGSVTYNLNGTINGVFAEGDQTIGNFFGTAVNAGDPDDSDGFNGIFEASD